MRGINRNHGTEPAAAGLLAGLLALLFALLAIDLGGCATYPRLPTSALRSLPTQNDYAVRVEVFCVSSDPFLADTPEMHRGYGSGVILDARHVLTAYHVAGCAYLPDVHVVLASGRRLRMFVDKEWPQRDVARLVIASAETFGDIPPPRFAAQGPGGAACSATAYPEREGNCGQVLSVFPMRCADAAGGPPCADISTSMIVHRGNSGSGVRAPLLGRLLAENGEPTGEGLLTSLWDIRNEVMS